MLYRLPWYRYTIICYILLYTGTFLFRFIHSRFKYIFKFNLDILDDFVRFEANEIRTYKILLSIILYSIDIACRNDNLPKINSIKFVETN